MGKAAKKRSRQQQEAVLERTREGDFLARPAVGNYLTIAAAVTFQFVLILLPLVGPAGSIAPHASKNFAAFLSVVLLALVLSGLAVFSKVKRRRIDGSPLPFLSMALTGASLFVLFALFTGLLSI